MIYLIVEGFIFQFNIEKPHHMSSFYIPKTKSKG